MTEFFRRFTILITKIVLGIIYRVELVNRENIPEKGPVLLCSNHIAELDMFLIGYRIKRWIFWMAKEELFKIPGIGAAIRWLGAFPVKRGRGDVGSIKKVFGHLDKGHIVGIFPEGTRRKGKKEKNIRVKPGAAMIAVKTEAPILPVAIEGNYKLFGHMKVVFGKPFYLDIDRNKKYNKEELIEISRDIMKKVYSLLEVK